MDAYQKAIDAIKAMPSPEGCGCAARKERLVAWMENPNNPMRQIMQRYQTGNLPKPPEREA